MLLLEATFLASKSLEIETLAGLNKSTQPQFNPIEAFFTLPTNRICELAFARPANTRQYNLLCYNSSSFQRGGLLPCLCPRRTPSTGYFCFVLVLPRNELFTRGLNSCKQTLDKGTHSLLDLSSGISRQKNNPQGLQNHIFWHRSLFSHPELSNGTSVALCPKVPSYRDAKLKHNLLFLHCKTFLLWFLLQLKTDTKGVFVSLNCF